MDATAGTAAQACCSSAAAMPQDQKPKEQKPGMLQQQQQEEKQEEKKYEKPPIPPKFRKIAVLGFPSVGKSSLTVQFAQDEFLNSYDPTIENTFNKMLTVDGQEFHLKLVDTAGQDEYSPFQQFYSLDVHGYVLVYSVTSNRSFQVIQSIHDKLKDIIGRVRVPMLLVGNKKDLSMDRVISYEEGKKLANSWHAAFIESTAKENEAVQEVFRQIVLEMERIDKNCMRSKFSCCVM
ncbi:unnamed protein product [Lampetra planeri]